MKKWLQVLLVMMLGITAVYADYESDEQVLDRKIQEAQEELKHYREQKKKAEAKKQEQEKKIQEESRTVSTSETDSAKVETVTTTRVEVIIDTDGIRRSSRKIKKQVRKTVEDALEEARLSGRAVLNNGEEVIEIKVNKPETPRPVEPVNKNRFAFGGFGGPVTRYSILDGQHALFTGGQGGVILNHWLVIGGCSYSLATPVETDMFLNGGPTYLNMNYGGLLVGINLFGKRRISLSLASSMGVGFLGYYQGDKDDFDFDPQNRFWFVEPSVTLNIKIFRFMEVGAGVGYRYVCHTDDYMNFNESSLSGYNASLELKFGVF